VADPFFKDLAFAALAQTARNPIGEFNRSVLGAQQLQRPAEPYLRQQYPEVYGGLGGFMGMAPDEMGGSVLDPNTARVRAGAQIGFPVGTATQVLPALNLIRPAVKAGAKALGPTAVSMGEGYLQRQGLMPNIVPSEPVGMLGSPMGELTVTGRRPTQVDPNALVFREKVQNRKADLKVDTDEFDPIVVIDDSGTLSILDGHNRASVAKDRGDSLAAVKIKQAEYDALQAQGFEDGEIAWAALQRANQSSSAGNLASQFPGSDIARGGDKAWDALIDIEGKSLTYPQQAALDLAQQRAALPIEQAMQIFDTAGLPNKGRDLIQSKAESLASQLRENGFNVDLQHSGSLAGPSSYLKIFDPQTGRSFAKDVRISGHSKGPFNTQSVLNVASDQELNNVISSAINMREMGVSKGMRQITDLENKAQEFIADGMKPKTAYKKARDFLDNQNNNQPVQQAMNEFEQSLINFMATPAK